MHDTNNNAPKTEKMSTVAQVYVSLHILLYFVAMGIAVYLLIRNEAQQGRGQGFLLAIIGAVIARLLASAVRAIKARWRGRR